MYCIYKLTSPSNKVYWGLTSNFPRRMRQHKCSVKGRHTKLTSAILKYGWESFKKEVVYSNLSFEEACYLEIELIRTHNTTETGYNISYGGYSAWKGQSDYMKLVMSDPEYKQKALTALHSNEDKRVASLQTPEFRAATSLRNKQLISEGKSKLPIIRKPIECIETGEQWPSITDCARELGGDRTHLRSHLKGDKYRPRFKGLHFKYLEVAHAL